MSKIKNIHARQILAAAPAAAIEPVGGSSIKARFMKPGKYSHVTWLGGNKAKY